MLQLLHSVRLTSKVAKIENTPGKLYLLLKFLKLSILKCAFHEVHHSITGCHCIQELEFSYTSQRRKQGIPRILLFTFFFLLKGTGGQVITFWCLVNEITKAPFGFCFFRNPNLRKKKQVKKKIFDNFLNFASKSSLRVIIWDNLSRWIVYVALKLQTMHLTSGVTFKFNGKDYFSKLMQR